MPDPLDFNSPKSSEPNVPESQVPEPIGSIELPPPEDAVQEGEWLKSTLHKWLDEEFLPEIINEHIAARASQVFVRQRIEGENNLNALVLAVLTEMQGYDFSRSFYSEFAIANAVGDLLLDSLGIERCCGN
ncbi:MAG: hypothetical protein WA783_08225 [Phormidesmis sp.]